MTTTLTYQQVRRAAAIVAEIESLEAARQDAKDMAVYIKLGAPTPERPMGADYTADVTVPIHATTICMVLVDMLTPLYTELRGLGIEYKKS